MSNDSSDNISSQLKYKRILLKLSGEVLAGEDKQGINGDVIRDLSRQIKEIHDLGIEIAIVIGGGNIFRGMHKAASEGIDRATADYMGMMGTVINSLALQDFLEREGLKTRVQTAIEVKSVAEPFIRRRALRHLEKGRVVVFGGGTGNPFFTTDTTAALRASEINAQILIKATKVDGVYDKDPVRFSDAKKFSSISYMNALNKQLKIMDATAFTLCMDNKMPILVFDINEKGALKKAVLGDNIGTIINNEGIL